MSHARPSVKKILSRITEPLCSSGFFNDLEQAIRGEPEVTSAVSCKSSYLIRNRALFFAKRLVDGEFKNILDVVNEIEESIPAFEHNEEIGEYHKIFMLRQLKLLSASPEHIKKILNLKTPFLNQKTEQVIRRTLRTSPKSKITALDIQKLVLSAFLTPLRQSVGSCFATAPAIYVQSEQAGLFFQDLEDLLNIGLLGRTFSGQELSIPLSPSWGPGLLDHPFAYSKQMKLYNTIEVQEIFYALKFFNESWSEEKKKKVAQSNLEKIGLKEGQWLTLNRFLNSLLQYQHKLTKQQIDDAHTRHKTFEQNPTLSPSGSKIEHYLEDLKEARQHLIQLQEHPLLKSWEYTIAYFAEAKSEFYKWNLYTSLGFDSKEKGGLSETIYNYLEDTLEKNKVEIERLDSEYEQEFFRVKYLEKRLRDLESDQMAAWARVEYQNHVNELHRHLRARDELIDKTERLSKILPLLIQSFDELLPRYFQELYDAQMQDYAKEIYEDSPAGFRLIYKHGRSDPSVWSFIESKEEFVASLKDFFVSIENELLAQENFEDFEKEVLEIITLSINHIQTEVFLKGAYLRICKRYHIPIREGMDFDKLPYKPWAYLSGGTLIGLISNYYKREQPFFEEKKRIANETELFAFLIETVRQFPQKELQQYIANPSKSLIMYSPSHAFLFKPGWMPLEGVWEKESYPFSWIRDHVTLPQSKFIDSIEVLPYQVVDFLEYYLKDDPYLCLWFKENVVWPNYSISIQTFAELLEGQLQRLPQSLITPRVTSEQIHGWIYEFFPVQSKEDLHQSAKRVIKLMRSADENQALDVLDNLMDHPIQARSISSKQFHTLLKATFLLLNRKSPAPGDSSKLLLDAMRECGYAMPRPVLFADTNWPYQAFAHLVNPATMKLELWRVDRLGQTGFPMLSWRKWFSEENPSTWSILTKPNEYRLPDKRAFLYPI